MATICTPGGDSCVPAGSRKTGSRESGIRIPSAFRKPRKGGEWDRDIQRAQGARNGEEPPLFTTPLQLSRVTVKCTSGADMQNKWREGRYGNSSSSSIQQRKKLMIKEGKRWNLAHTRFAPFQAAPHRSTESRTLPTARGRQGEQLGAGRRQAGQFSSSRFSLCSRMLQFLRFVRFLAPAMATSQISTALERVPPARPECALLFYCGFMRSILSMGK